MKARFSPAALTTSTTSSPGGVTVVAGDVADFPKEWAEQVMRDVPGVDGAPCLVPIDPPKAKPTKE